MNRHVSLANMTNSRPVSGNLNLFVTHIDADEPLLRIHAQTDKELPCRIERILNSLTKQFNEGLGRPVPDKYLSLGAGGGICCALFEKAYYRARIRSSHPTGNIIVQFIDYGNTEIVHPHDIRILDGIAGAAELMQLHPLAEKFFIAGVLPKNNKWDQRDLGDVLLQLRYNDCPAKIVASVGPDRQIHLIDMFFNGQDFARFLVAQNMAIMASIEDQLRAYVQSPHLHSPPIQQSQMHMQKPLLQIPLVLPQPSPRIIDNYGVGREHSSLRLPRTQHYQESWQGQIQQAPPNLPPIMSIPPPTIPLHHQHADPGVFRSRILKVGSQYEVTVPYVEDGPLMFSVRECSTEEELNILMHRINKTHTPEPLVEPPEIGTVCLGRYSNSKALLRAVVGQVREHGCKIHYVDYGYVEVVPFTDMYQLPREFINPRALSIRFTMSNVNEVNITDETKEYFKSYVAGKKLRLYVRPPETSSLIQCGDLYNNDRNIKDILQSVFGDSVAKWPSPCELLRDSREIVQVVCVDAPIIFVQLDSDAPLFASMNSDLAEYVATAPPLKPSQLKKGLACIAVSSTDFTWYRAEIVNVSGDNVTVSYVDYGNQEIIPVGSIRSIRDKNTSIMKLRAQGIRCVLNDYHEIKSQELQDSLEAEIMDKPVAMIVTKIGSDGPIVDLFDSKVEPLVNIIHRLKRASLTNGNVDKRTDSHNDKSRNIGNSNVNRRSVVKKQPNVGQQQKSKSQNVKAAREDQINKWNNTPRSDNPRITESNNSMEKGRSNNWKDDENEQRRYDNRYQNRGNEKEWQSNAAGQRQQNDRFSRNDGRNDRTTRDESKHERYDRFANDANANSRQTGRDNRENCGGRGGFSNSRFPGNNARSERQSSADKSWSDKDSDTSSRGSGRNNRRGNNNNGGIGGRTRRDGDGDRGGFKNGQRTNGASARIARDNMRDFGERNEIKQQFGNWPSTDEKIPTTSSKNIVIPPPNITVGAVKNCEIVFVKDPTDFHLQLSPDNLELDSIMARIATSYVDNTGKILGKSSIEPGMGCVAQYSEDSKWYRATVKSVEGNNGAIVNFVDYGNVEFVEFEKIKELEAEYAQLSAQAIACKLLAASKSTWDSTEIDKFSLLTDGKLLEAEFVNQENNIYEILLREIVDDAPATNYINEDFSDGADLTKAKNNARYKERHGQIVVPDYVPIDYKWSVELPTAGSKQNVIVPWFTNPENFYCQMLTAKDQFRQMMLDVQKVYASRQPVDLPLQIGSAVMAVFSDDGAFYRAEILELNKERGNIVRYVDFGNTAMVEPRNIYRVERRFTTMPKQAFNCSLKNIVPANGSTWSRANRQEIEKCFEFDNFECTIHEIKDNSKFIISLSHAGTDVAGLLVEKALASFAVSASPVQAEKNEVDETKQPSEVEPLPRFDISLLAGQVLRVRVSNVASAAKFHIQLPSANASEMLIDAYMAQNDPKVMPRLSCGEVCLGAGCLVNTDEGWRRAVVVNCSRTTGFDVRLIDTGANDEIPLDCMLALPGELSVMQNQAVECCLKNATTSIVLDEKLRDMIENTDVIIAIDEVDNNRLIVKLYDANGERIKLSDEEDENEKICPVCPMPILYSSQKVSVSHAEHSSSVWLKRTADVELDGELHGKLFDHYDVSTGPAPVAHPGALCAAKSSDENWYRAKVVRTTQFGVLVHFIDYGNTEDVPFESLRVLENEFFVQPQLAIEVALTVSLEGSMEQQQDILREHIVDQEFIATMYNVRKKWVAELTNEEGKMSEKLGSLEAVQVLKNRHVQAEVSEMIVGGRYAVNCCHADNPARFWLQRDEEIPAIEQLQEKLQIEATNAEILNGIPEIGTLCLAMYSIDKQWYRAVVLDADEDITSIRFIDFGNTDVVDTNMGRIKKISDSLKAIKSYAIKCRLDVIPYGGEDWMTAAAEWFEAIITSVEHVEALVIADTEPRRVELFVGDTSIVDGLVKRNFATRIHTEEDLIEEIVEREVDLRAAYVSHAISPSEFWIQQEKYVGDLEILADRFLVADMFPELTNIEEGMLCVAKFPEDGSWYRARVISHADTGTEVIYVDYGNSAISTEIREIPADSAAQPAFSKKCRLVLPEGVEQWSEEACVEFVKMAAEGATIFQLEMIEERDDTSIVRLTQDGKDIVESLTKLCSPRVPIIEERLSPLGEENSPNVLVSHVNSPSDFSTQAESAITELEVMSDHLATAETFLPLDNIEEGMICAAKFPEDDLWYRAKILSHGDAGTEVHYIDYGNSAITTELKVLPEDIVTKPALSTCCSLRMPEDIVSWSKEACEKFFELVNDGITMFQYEILDDKEKTTLIRLSIEGKDIVDLLAPLCTKISRKNEEITNPINEEETVSREQAETQDVQEIVESIVDRVTLDSFEQTSSTETSGVDVITTSENSTLGSCMKLETSTESSTMHVSESTNVASGESITPSHVRAPDDIHELDKEVQIIEEIVKIEPEVEVIIESSEIDEDNATELTKINDIENRLEEAFTIGETEEATIVDEEPSIRPKTPVTEKILPGSISRGLTEEDIILDQIERLDAVPIADKIVPGSINKGEDLVVENSSNEESIQQPFIDKVIVDPKSTEANLSPVIARKLSFCEKIVPGSISRGDSPIAELKCPTTPKTPHSEKLVAGVVNLQEKLAGFEEDEVLSIVTDENIPK